MREKTQDIYKPLIIELPHDFAFDVQQAAKIACCSPQTIMAHINRYVNDPTDRYAIRARQNTPGGKIWIYASDLKDYLERTVIGATVTNKKIK